MARALQENEGKWFRRVYNKSNYQSTKWHLIKAATADRYITKCGREMSVDTGNAGGQSLQFTMESPEYIALKCSQCYSD